MEKLQTPLPPKKIDKTNHIKNISKKQEKFLKKGKYKRWIQIRILYSNWFYILKKLVIVIPINMLKVCISSLVICLSFTLLGLPLTWFSYIGCLALYFMLEELPDYVKRFKL